MFRYLSSMSNERKIASDTYKINSNKGTIDLKIIEDAYSAARIIRDGTIIFSGKIGSIFREKNQAKQVSTGQECGITLKDFSDYQKKDIIEAFNSKTTERVI